MQVDKVTNNTGYEGYAARVYRQQLDLVHAQQIVDRRQKISEENKAVEASRLNQYTEEQRIARNQMIFKQYKDIELYLFKLRALQLQENKNIQLGTKVDLYC
jgi:hypothetical protein